MHDLHLHIVSFDIPYPANYGGVIDVFYKIRALHEAGVKIHLHCFEYHRKPAPELDKYCHEVHYYPRKTRVSSAVGLTPYIIYSRRSGQLLKNLSLDDHPILFEGLHSCYYLSHSILKNRIKIYRESNIEHHYYYHLFKAEKKIVNKVFFFISGIKLRIFQQNLKHASLMLTVSSEDNAYLSSRFPGVRVECLPSFHRDDEVDILQGSGDYILYQGNLCVAENSKAAEFLITKVFTGSGLKLVIAGLNPPESLIRIAAKFDNVQLEANPSDAKMAGLIRHAHINVMVTFQATGLKLKLLTALFTGRHCLVNRKMVAGTELAGIVNVADDPAGLRNRAAELMKIPFTEEMISARRKVLMKWHSNKENCKTLVNFLTLLSSK